MNLMPEVRAPKRRHSDGWRAYLPGGAIMGIALALHLSGQLGEHVTMGVIALGATRLPAGRVRDGKRWQLARSSGGGR